MTRMAPRACDPPRSRTAYVVRGRALLCVLTPWQAMSRAPLLANAESGAIDPWDPASALNNRAQADDPLDEGAVCAARLSAAPLLTPL